MSPKLREQLEYTLQEIARLRSDFGLRIQQAVIAELSDDDCIILSTALHSFYNLIESALKVIAGEFGEIPDGADWHARLLAVFADGQSRSGLVLPDDLRLRLSALMRFRHVFRHIYVLDIDPERLRPLLADFELLAREFTALLTNWLAGGQGH